MSLYEKKAHQDKIAIQNKEKIEELRLQQQSNARKQQLLNEDSSPVGQQKQFQLELEQKSIAEELAEYAYEKAQAERLSIALEKVFNHTMYERLNLVDKYNRKIKDRQELEKEMHDLEDSHIAEQRTNIMELQEAENQYALIKKFSSH